MEAATVESTPVATPETSSPAPSAIASSSPAPSTSQRPTTADDLGSWMRSHATEQDNPAVAPEASAATAQPTTTDPAGDHPSATQGPIPFTVHKTALENARTKEREAATAEFDQQYGWAKTVPRETIQQWGGIANLMASDPPAFLEKYFAEAVQHPTFGPQVKSWAARALASRAPQAQQAPAEPQPDRQIIDEHGQVIGMAFSDGGKAHTEWLNRQWQAKLDQTVQPFVHEREQSQAQARAAETQKQIDARTNDLISDISEVLEIGADTAPEQRDTLFKAVNALMAADPKLSVHKAAMQVRKSHVVPGQKASATRSALDIIHHKAAGNTAGNSGSATPLKRPTNEAELAAYMRSLER